MVAVTVWNEFRRERSDDAAARVYPEGIHAVLAGALTDRGHDVRTATLDEPEHGLTPSVLGDTDVLVWWGHSAHGEVADGIVDRVCSRVHEGMGLVALHSAHYSKPFRRLMGTPCTLAYREAGERERIWAVDPGHPIAAGVGESLVVPQAETYGEPFAVPEPERLVFVSWFEGGEVFRSGCCYQRGNGRIFYFRPGHETYPVYHREAVQGVLDNAVQWTGRRTDPAVTHENRYADPVE